LLHNSNSNSKKNGGPQGSLFFYPLLFSWGGEILPIPPTPTCMLPEYKRKSLDALKRLEGLTKKVRSMVEQDEYCTHILENLLAMEGHIKHARGQVLESHLHTCAKKKMKSEKDYDAFIADIIRTIGLSRR